MLKPSDLMDAGSRPYNSPAGVRRSDLRFARDITPEADAPPLAAAVPAKTEADADRPSLPWVLFEGFAVYGAWLDVMAPAAPSSDDVDTRQPQRLSRLPKRASTALVLVPAPADATAYKRGVVTYELAVLEADRPNWAIRVWRFVACRWTNWRREQRMRQAVATLAEFDDRSLRDVGISRSEIDYVVRHGRAELADDLASR
jgi:uncharacterized protein YjiS (DUF1127 family)